MNTPEPVPCTGCGAPIRALVFPTLLRPQGPGAKAEAVIIDGESSCFYHPTKKAAIPCDGCGRFLCTLCDVEFGNQHLCPVCLENAPKKGQLVQLDHSRIQHDTVALLLAVFPLFFCGPLMIVTAPVAFYYCFRYWNTPMSVLPRSRVRFVIAFLFASLQIMGIGFFLLMLVAR